MRWKLPTLVVLALFLAPVTLIHAAPVDNGRKPDVGGIRCSNDAAGVCITRLVGDLNGDEIDDLLVERMTDAEFRSGVVSNFDARQFEIILGPFRPDAQGQWTGQPTALVRLKVGQVRAPIALADVDGDGRNELIFTANEMRSNPDSHEAQRVAVVFASDWSNASAPGTAQRTVNLGKATGGKIEIERKVMLAGRDADFVPDSRITPAFADVNADGKMDIVLGVDPASQSTLDQAKTHASDASSEIAVMFGDGSLGHQAGKIHFKDDLVLHDLGACSQSLAGVADVSGDGVPDIVARECRGNGLPDQLRVVTGGASVAQAAQASEDFVPIRLPDLDLVLHGAAALLPPALAYPMGNVDGGGESPNVPPPSEPGRGYLPGGGEPLTPVFPAPFFLEDVNADGVRDIVLGFGDNTHIWLGGADIAARVAAMRTDRVYVHAGYGRMSTTSSWQPVDFNADGRRDLLLTGLAAPASASTCPANARCIAPGIPGGSGVGGGVAKPDGLSSMRFFQHDWTAIDVLDAEQDEPDAIWESDSLTPWGMGDFNGDGKVDLLLGESIPNSHATADRLATPGFSIAFGPFK